MSFSRDSIYRDSEHNGHRNRGRRQSFAYLEEQEDSCVPFPLRWLYDRLFTDLREETDDFDAMLRKIVISAGIPLVIFPIAFVLYLAIELGRNPDAVSAGPLIALVVMFVFPLTWIPSFLYVHHTKDAHDVLMDVWLFVTILGVAMLSISLVEYPCPQLAFWLAVMALLCHTPRLVLQLCLCVCAYVIGMLNNAFSGLNPVADATLLAVPNPYRGSMLERIAYHVTAFIIGIVVLGAVIMQTKENLRMMAAAQNGVNLARDVADLLADYDTESAKRVLTNFDRTADPALHSSFNHIVENLEKYRQFLPGWLTHQQHTDVDVNQKMLHKPDIEIVDVSPQSEELNTNEGANDPAFGNFVSSTAPRTAAHAGGPSTPSIVNLVGSGKTSKTFNGKITVVYGDIVVRVPSQEQSQSSFEETMNNVVASIQNAAAATNGALHSIVGDHVVLSWNGVQRVMQPELKACRFLAAAPSFSDDERVSFTGAAMTGDARANFYGDESEKTFSARFRWRDALRSLAQYARAHKVRVVDASTYSTGFYEVEMYPADLMKVADWRTTESSKMLSPSHRTLFRERSSSVTSASGAPNGQRFMTMTVYEIAQEKEVDGEEWMYAMQRGSRSHRSNNGDEDDEEPLDAALNQCNEGRYNDAIATLKGLIGNMSNANKTATTSQPGRGVADDFDSSDSSLAATPSPILRLLRKAERLHSRQAPADAFAENWAPPTPHLDYTAVGSPRRSPMF